MELEKQVCNLELAQKLKKLGVKQESLFYWRSNAIGKPNGEPYYLADNHVGFTHYMSAFTVGELLHLMPNALYSPNLTDKSCLLWCHHGAANFVSQRNHALDVVHHLRRR